MSDLNNLEIANHLSEFLKKKGLDRVIRKKTEKGRTRTTIERLDDPGRVDELAAMLRGDDAAENTRAEAQAMLAEGRGRR